METIYKTILDKYFLKQQEMIEFYKDLLTFWHIKVYLAIGVLLDLLTLFLSYKISSMFRKDDLIILHYNVDFGINLVGQSVQIYSLPLAGLFIILFNFFILFLIRTYSTYKKFNQHLLLSSAIIINSLIFFACSALLLININQ